MVCSICGKDLADGEICECQSGAVFWEEPQIPQQYYAPPQQQPFYPPPPQYPQNPYYAPPPPYYGIPARPSNGVAVAGFVLATIGIILGWIPFIGWILWILGCILSIVGIAVSGNRAGTGRGLSIAGLIISVVNIFVIILVARYTVFNRC